MPVEIESKIRVDDHDAVRRRLEEAGAAYIGRVLERNALFDRADGSLRADGCALRVRSVEVLDGRGPGATLTYKGPKQPGLVVWQGNEGEHPFPGPEGSKPADTFKRREELETEVSDAEATTAVLRALGFEETLIFEKRRESWLLPPCHVELDEVAQLGNFVEVEGEDEACIAAVLAKIGLDSAAGLTESYVAMLARDIPDSRPRPWLLCFDE